MKPPDPNAALPVADAALVDHPDRARWNAKYRDRASAFATNPLLAEALALGPPDGPVLELACGLSGAALSLAAAGRAVTCVDVSDIALAQLAAEAERRGVGAHITPIHADASAQLPIPPAGYALVIAARYWDPAALNRAVGALAPGGLLCWSAFPLAHRRYQPGFPIAYCLPEGEPAASLVSQMWSASSLRVIVDRDDDDGARILRHVIARRTS